MVIQASEAPRIAVGLVIMAYVGYCILRQKVWLRGPIGLSSKTFSWGTREENQTVFWLHVIFGSVFGVWMAHPLLYQYYLLF